MKCFLSSVTKPITSKRRTGERRDVSRHWHTQPTNQLKVSESIIWIWHFAHNFEQTLFFSWQNRLCLVVSQMQGIFSFRNDEERLWKELDTLTHSDEVRECNDWTFLRPKLNHFPILISGQLQGRASGERSKKWIMEPRSIGFHNHREALLALSHLRHYMLNRVNPQ